MAEERVLTDLAFSILVALGAEPLHGYALVKRLRETEGRSGLRTGTVYAALARLQDEGWVEEVEGHPGQAEDERRRYWAATPSGLEAARAEARRLEGLLERARALLPGAPGA